MMLPIFGEIFSNGLHNSGNSEIAGAQLLGMFGGMALFVIGMILTFPISIFLPAAIAHGIAGDSFIAIFRIGAWWKILRANIGGFFTAFVLIMGLYMILIFALQVVYMTLILCFLLPFMSAILMFYLTLVCAVAIAEAYRRGAQISGREAAIEKPLHFDPV
jgi:hypothetical protein